PVFLMMSFRGSFSVSLGRFAATNLLAALEPTSLCNQIASSDEESAGPLKCKFLGPEGPSEGHRLRDASYGAGVPDLPSWFCCGPLARAINTTFLRAPGSAGDPSST